MKNLLNGNAARLNDETSTSAPRDAEQLFLPYVAINTSKDTVIQCEMIEDGHLLQLHHSV
jgi:hypothetical protein